jgi:hypothetical protein
MPASQNGFDILKRAILRVTGDVSGSQLPAEAHVPEEIKHGLVLHYLRRRHQSRKDDALLTPIDHKWV